MEKVAPGIDEIDYARIEEAISIIRRTFRAQPSLEDIARHVHLSPFQFQRMFTEWAGVSPKKFLQYTSLEYVRKTLQESRPSLSKIAFDAGLSGTGRLHGLFVTIEAMTPEEYSNSGKNLQITYSFSPTLFGDILVATTIKGICHLAFIENPEKGFEKLLERFPKANFINQKEKGHVEAIRAINGLLEECSHIHLHIKGTGFQLMVWEALLKIPTGHLQTYRDIAQSAGKPLAARAAGTAIGANPVAYLIPCHRVIQSTGETGGYMWGQDRKVAMIALEAIRKT